MNRFTAAVPGPPGAGSRRSFADLSVNVKILMSVALAALVALVIGVTGLSALSDASGSAQRIYRSNVASVKAIGAVAKALVQARLDTSFQLIEQGAAGTRKYTDAFAADVETFEAALAAYRASDPSGDPARVAAELGTGAASLYRYVDSRDDLLNLMTDEDTISRVLVGLLGG